jgi:hypothetical protein
MQRTDEGAARAPCLNAECSGYLLPEVPARHVHRQLSYLHSLFDVAAARRRVERMRTAHPEISFEGFHTTFGAPAPAAAGHAIRSSSSVSVRRGTNLLSWLCEKCWMRCCFAAADSGHPETIKFETLRRDVEAVLAVCAFNFVDMDELFAVRAPALK